MEGYCTSRLKGFEALRNQRLIGGAAFEEEIVRLVQFLILQRSDLLAVIF
jgi:hypothetical protein